MELQLALDMVEEEKGLAVAKSVADLIDILELGTPYSFIYSIDSVGMYKKVLPGVRILSDFKIMDGGYGMAEIAYKAGADVTTVSARTWDDTVKQAIQAARDNGRQILVDMMGVPEDEIAKRGAEIDAMKPDYICIHRAVSVASSASPEEPLRMLREVVKNAKVPVAGGINCETLKKVVQYHPDLVIIGSAISSAENPRAVAEEMRGIMEGK